MIGFVVVSHSATLADAAVDLALQMVHDEAPPVRVAAGAAGGFGTDAAAIAQAIDELADTDGVLIVTDLGSAVLSSSLALDLRESAVPVRISDGPFVEGLTAGIVRAVTGGTLDEVTAEARRALDAKRQDDVAETGADAAPAAAPVEVAPAVAVAEVTLVNEVGLHSRPAASVVKTVGRFDAAVTVTNATSGKGPVSASSLIGLLSLAAGKGDVLRIAGDGADAVAAVTAVHDLAADGFGEAA